MKIACVYNNLALRIIILIIMIAGAYAFLTINNAPKDITGAVLIVNANAIPNHCRLQVYQTQSTHGIVKPAHGIALKMQLMIAVNITHLSSLTSTALNPANVEFFIKTAQRANTGTPPVATVSANPKIVDPTGSGIPVTTLRI